MRRYLSTWKGRALDEIGVDRAGVRTLYHHLENKYGRASASQTIRMFSAVYRYARKVGFVGRFLVIIVGRIAGDHRGVEVIAGAADRLQADPDGPPDRPPGSGWL